MSDDRGSGWKFEATEKSYAEALEACQFYLEIYPQVGALVAGKYEGEKRLKLNLAFAREWHRVCMFIEGGCNEREDWLRKLCKQFASENVISVKAFRRISEKYEKISKAKIFSNVINPPKETLAEKGPLTAEELVGVF